MGSLQMMVSWSDTSSFVMSLCWLCRKNVYVSVSAHISPPMQNLLFDACRSVHKGREVLKKI